MEARVLTRRITTDASVLQDIQEPIVRQRLTHVTLILV